MNNHDSWKIHIFYDNHDSWKTTQFLWTAMTHEQSWLMKIRIFVYEKARFFEMILWTKTCLFGPIFWPEQNIFSGSIFGSEKHFSGMIPGSFWHHPGVIQGSSRHHFKLVLGDFRVIFDENFRNPKIDPGWSAHLVEVVWCYSRLHRSSKNATFSWNTDRKSDFSGAYYSYLFLFFCCQLWHQHQQHQHDGVFQGPPPTIVPRGFL